MKISAPELWSWDVCAHGCADPSRSEQKFKFDRTKQAAGNIVEEFGVSN